MLIFKTKALAVQKLKGKENCETNTETANFMYNFVQKTNATNTSNFDSIFYQLRNWIFSHGFHQKVRFRMTFKNRPKGIFVKSKFQPYNDPLIH